MLVTPGNLSEVCATIREAKDRGIDTETTGPEETDLPFACIIAVEGEVFYFDDRSCPGFWSAPDFVSLFHEEHCTWHLQNAKFDMRMLESKGLPPLRNVNDIAVQARIQRNDHLAYSLDAQAKRPVCNQEIAQHLGQPINTVTPRMNELVKLGSAEEAFREVYPVTNRKVIYWKAKK